MPRLKQKPPAGDDLGEQVEEEFREFLDSMPAESTSRITLYKIPSDLTPELLENTRLGAPHLAPFDNMVDQVRRTHGVGKYQMHISLMGSNGQRLKYLKPSFRIGDAPGSTPGHGAGDVYADGQPLSTDEVLDMLRRSVATQAQGAELATLAGLLGGKPKEGSAPSPDPLKTTMEMLTLFKTAFPQTDPLTILKTAKDLLGPAGGGGGGSADMVAMVKELMLLAREMGGGEGAAPSGWWSVLPHVVELGKTLAPYLPNIAQAIVQARATMEVVRHTPGGAPVVTARPEAVPTGAPAALGADPGGEFVGVNKQAIFAAVNQSAPLARALETVLDSAEFEAARDLPWEASNEDVLEIYDELATLADRRVPGLTATVAANSSEQVWTYWTTLDPRMARAPNGRAFVEGFRQFLATPPAAPDATPPPA